MNVSIQKRDVTNLIYKQESEQITDTKVLMLMRWYFCIEANSVEKITSAHNNVCVTYVSFMHQLTHTLTHSFLFVDRSVDLVLVEWLD